MADFNTAYNATMKNEGGYSNDVNDSGGETWKGVSRISHPDWTGWTIVDAIKAQKPSNLNAALTANQQLEISVVTFYKTSFWNSSSLDQVNNQQIANQLFDISVNMGQKTAALFLQKSINQLTGNSLVVDGIIGLKTIAALKSVQNKDLYNQINVLRAAYYEAIIAKNPSQAIFRRSWFSRILPFTEATTGEA